MNVKKPAIVFSLILLIANQSHAAEFVTLTQFSLWSDTYGEDTIRITAAGGVPNPEGCHDADSYFVKSTLSTTVKMRIYNTLLAAKMGEKPIKIYLDGCESSRPAVSTVIIE